LQILKEISEVNIPTYQTCWGQKYSHDYSTLYPARTWAEASAIENNKMSVPVLVKSSTGADNWCLITESANYGTYCASDLMTGTANETGHFYYQLYGNVNAALPLETSWKTIIIGALPTIVQSTMNENLNPPTDMQDLSWIKPGLSSWDWGGQDGSVTHDINVLKEYINLASQMSWPYYTLDDGWLASTYQLKDVVDYAATKNVKLFIWSHQNYFKNSDEDIRTILQNWKNIGFAGTKIDFFDNDSQEMMLKYDRLIKIAGEVGLMINLHGCTKPSGTRRHWPHLITSEAVYGGEQYFFNHLATPASHNVTLALTRNVIGPMDYTPTEFCRLDGIVRHLTTWSHQVALAVLYESGIQTMSDSYYNYIYNMSKNLLSQLPSAWNDTKCLEASPDEFVTIARRSENDWYVASISQVARTLNIPLDFLGEGTYTAQIYKDGTCPSDIAYEEKSVTNISSLSVDIKATGGATIRISKNPIIQPAHRVYEAEAGVKNGGIITENDSYGNCSGGKFATFIGKGNTITVNNVQADRAGKYNLTFYYISRDDRKTYVKVNDGTKQEFTFKGNGYSWNSEGLALKTVLVTLKEGTNSFEFGNDTGDAVNIDRIEVSPSEDYKVVNVEIVNPKNESTFTSNEDFKVKLMNQNNEAVSNISVSYQINGNTAVTETVPLLNAGETKEYTFAQKVDLSKAAIYHLKAIVNANTEINLVGDMAIGKIVHYPDTNESPVSLKSNGGSIHSYSYQVNTGESAENLILGDSTKKWCDDKTLYPYVIIKLPELYMVDRFMFRDCKTRESNSKNVDTYTISISTKDPNENEWTEVVTAVDCRSEDIKIDNINPQEALYIKLSTKIPYSDNAIRIYGFDIFGTKKNQTLNKDIVMSNFSIFPSVIKKGDSIYTSTDEKGSLSIYSVNGNLVHSQNVTLNSKIQINSSPGLYFVKLTSLGSENVEKLIVR
jgi:alpha-glucosidase